MKKLSSISALIIAIAVSISLSSTGICATAGIKTPSTTAKATVTAESNSTQYQEVQPLDLVANPQCYLNKKIKMNAQFDKFSTIGLDYPPVNRSSKDYISFIIKRPDVENKGYTIPLPELKLIIKRDKAEKLIDLESGDKIEIKGTEFSTAIGDPWVDVDEVKILEPKTKPAKK